MVGFDQRQRAALIDKLPDTANIALGGLLFGQAVVAQAFSVLLAAAGVVAWVLLMAWSMFLAKGRPE